VAEAPLNMRVAMAMAALICIGIGVAPELLYGLLPYDMDYPPYTTAHVVNQLQLLLLAAMAFTLLVRTGLYPPELRSVNLDADAIYRRAVPAGWHALSREASRLPQRLRAPLRRPTAALWEAATGPFQPNGRIARPWSTHLMVWWIAVLFGLVLLLTLL
jgi:multicomponent Na+:H+ antiporter subunit D